MALADSLLLVVVLAGAALHPLLFLQVIAVKPLADLRVNSMILQNSIVEEINANPNAGWKAAKNHYFTNYTVGQFKRILGVKPTPQNALEDIPVKSYPKSLWLPKNFDARTTWSQCSTIGRILDQGHCGSCWAFGAVESLSDRFCIHFAVNISLSVNDLLACCGFMCGDGCDGGYPIYAWKYFVENGVVTEEVHRSQLLIFPLFGREGRAPRTSAARDHTKRLACGPHRRAKQCDPYFDNTGCAHPGCEPAYPTPQCEKQCKDKNLLWEETKHFSVNAYRVNSDPRDIMTEVYTNGPVEVAFTVYEDFAHYKSGVYKHLTGDVLGGHAVKLIGWGTSDEGEDYWLLANQWNRGWGDDGYFKILRGTNECGIEADVVAGLPSSKNLIRSNVKSDEARDASA